MKHPKLRLTKLASTIVPETLKLSSSSRMLHMAGRKHGNLTFLGIHRANAFKRDVMPTLLSDMFALFGIKSPEKRHQLKTLLTPIVEGSGLKKESFGLTTKEGKTTVDSDYPPRASNAVWADFASALGLSSAEILYVNEFKKRIGQLVVPAKRYAPEMSTLTPADVDATRRVAQAILSNDLSGLNLQEKALAAFCMLNNFAWHTSNWQKAAIDKNRADPAERNNVFTVYSENLDLALTRGGMDAVIDMMISDAYNAGKPNIGTLSGTGAQANGSQIVEPPARHTTIPTASEGTHVAGGNNLFEESE